MYMHVHIHMYVGSLLMINNNIVELVKWHSGRDTITDSGIRIRPVSLL